MMKILPLLRVWLMLIALTGAAMLVGHVGGLGRLQRWEVGVLLVLSFFKAALVLRHYLELARGSAWFSGLISALVFLLAGIFGLALLT